MSLDLTALLSSLTPSSGGMGSLAPDMSGMGGEGARFNDLVEQLNASTQTATQAEAIAPQTVAHQATALQAESGQAAPAKIWPKSDLVKSDLPKTDLPKLDQPRTGLSEVSLPDTTSDVALPTTVALAVDVDVSAPNNANPEKASPETDKALASAVALSPSEDETTRLAMPRPVRDQMVDIQISATAPQTAPVVEISPPESSPPESSLQESSPQESVPPESAPTWSASIQVASLQVAPLQVAFGALGQPVVPAPSADMPSAPVIQAAEPAPAMPESSAEVPVSKSVEPAKSQAMAEPSGVPQSLTTPVVTIAAPRAALATDMQAINQAGSQIAVPPQAQAEVAFARPQTATEASVPAPVSEAPARPEAVVMPNLGHTSLVRAASDPVETDQTPDTIIAPAPVPVATPAPVPSEGIIFGANVPGSLIPGPVVDAPVTQPPVVQVSATPEAQVPLKPRAPQAGVTQDQSAPALRLDEAAVVETSAPVWTEIAKPKAITAETAPAGSAKPDRISAKSVDETSVEGEAAPSPSVVQIAADAGLVPVITVPVPALMPTSAQASAPALPPLDLLADNRAQPVAPKPDLGGPEDRASDAPAQDQPPKPLQPVAPESSASPPVPAAPTGNIQMAVTPAAAVQASTPQMQPAEVQQAQIPQTQIPQTQIPPAQANQAVTVAAEQVAAVATSAAASRPFRLINAPQINTPKVNTAQPRSVSTAQAPVAPLPAEATGDSANPETKVAVAAVQPTTRVAPVAVAQSDPNLAHPNLDAQTLAPDLTGTSATPPVVKPVIRSVADAVRISDSQVSATAQLSAEAAAAPLVASTPVGAANDVIIQTAPVPVASVDTVAAPSPLSTSQMSQAAAENMGALGLAISKRVSEGTTRFAMELHPADMGRVDVQLRIDRTGELTAHLSFDDAITSTAFRARESELREQLSQTGLNLSANALSFSSRADNQASANTPSASPILASPSDPRSDTATSQGGGQNQSQPQFAQDQQRSDPQAAARALALANRTLENADLDTALADLSYRPGAQTLALNLIV